MAIVGTDPAFGASPPLQPLESPVSYGQSWPELKPLTCTWTSGVTIRFGIFSSAGSRSALIVVARPSISVSRRFSSVPSSAKLFTRVSAETAGEIAPFVLWMITRTYWFGCVFAPFSRPGEIQVRLGDAPRASRACLLALAASGTLMASIATSAVTAPRPPFPHRALDRASPPRLPVPHSALDRDSPRLPPFIRTFRVSFPRARAGRMTACPRRMRSARPPKSQAEPRPAGRAATSPGRVRPVEVPSNG